MVAKPKFALGIYQYSPFDRTMNNRIGILILFVISIGMIQCSLQGQYQSPEIPIESLQQGDLAFRRGESFTIDIVAYNDRDGRYSHIGIIVESDSGLMVVHSVAGNHPTQPGSDIIRIEHIDQFFAPDMARCGEIVRLELDSTQQSMLGKMALKKVTEKIPFDHNYDLSDTTHLYCTELVKLLYQNIGIDLTQGRLTHINAPGMSNDYIMPSDIYQNNKLKTIFIY